MVAPLAAVGAEVAGCCSAPKMHSALQKKQAAWTLPEGDQRPLSLHALHKVLPRAPRPDGGGLLARTHRQRRMPALSLQHAVLRTASHIVRAVCVHCYCRGRLRIRRGLCDWIPILCNGRHLLR